MDVLPRLNRLPRHTNTHTILDHFVPFLKIDQRDLMTKWDRFCRTDSYRAVAVHVDCCALTWCDILNGDGHAVTLVMDKEFWSGRRPDLLYRLCLALAHVYSFASKFFGEWLYEYAVTATTFDWKGWTRLLCLLLFNRISKGFQISKMVLDIVIEEIAVERTGVMYQGITQIGKRFQAVGK